MTPTSSNTATTASVSPSVATTSSPIGSPWPGVDRAKLREAIARAATATSSSASTPAMDFGRYVRKELDRSPDRVGGMLAMARFLKCDPIGRQIESLQRDVAELKAWPRGQESAQPSDQNQSGERRLKAAGDNKTRRGRKTEKQTTKSHASKLLRQLQKAVLHEIREELGQPDESVIQTEMAERVFSKSDAELTTILHERFHFPLTGRKTLSRTPEYISWAPYRARGNSRRLDPESPAVDATAAGGRSSKSGATRNAKFVADNRLRECRLGRIRPLDAEGHRKINDDPESRAFANAHPEFFGEDVDLCG